MIPDVRGRRDRLRSGVILEPMADTSLDETTALLERTPRVVRALLDGLPERWLVTPDTADGWTPRDVVGHLNPAPQGRQRVARRIA